MLRLPRSDRRGLTFVEMMVASTILSSFALMVMLWLNGTSDTWWTSTTQEQVRADTRRVMTRMLTEVMSGTRSTSPVAPGALIGGGGTSLTFYVPTDSALDGNNLIIDDNGNTEWDTTKPVLLAYDAPTQELRRTFDGQTAVLARGVTAIQFSDVTTDPALLPNEVRVALTMRLTTPRGRQLTSTSTETVRLRN